MRLRRHPILEFVRENKIKFYFNDVMLEAYEGETVASALYANGIKVLTYSAKYERPRGFFCGIGKCSSCLMTVDGVPNVKTCVTLVKDGMRVQSQRGFGSITNLKAEKRKIKKDMMKTDIAIVGAGPAGLEAAVWAGKFANVIVIDENPLIGGQLIKQTHKFFGSRDQYAGIRGIEIANLLSQQFIGTGVNIIKNTTVIGYYKNKNNDTYQHIIAAVRNDIQLIEIHAKKLIIATGAQENMLAFPGNDLPGVVGAGGLQTLMNVYGIKLGCNALMVGSGNVGLIVSYQMLQAGINVKMVIEALPKIGGYFVHAAKLRRLGVPIFTSHTIKEVSGNGTVERATIVELDKNWNPIRGSEKEIDVDLVCLAVGLTPSSELLFQAGCKSIHIPELGGWIAWHNKNLETSIKGIYVAGDVSGIEEASTAMLEGKIAGLHAGMKVRKTDKFTSESPLANPRILKLLLEYKGELHKAMKELEKLRQGPFGERARKGKERLWRK